MGLAQIGLGVGEGHRQHRERTFCAFSQHSCQDRPPKVSAGVPTEPPGAPQPKARLFTAATREAQALGPLALLSQCWGPAGGRWTTLGGRLAVVLEMEEISRLTEKTFSNNKRDRFPAFWLRSSANSERNII